VQPFQRIPPPPIRIQTAATHAFHFRHAACEYPSCERTTSAVGLSGRSGALLQREDGGDESFGPPKDNRDRHDGLTRC
jgi:hypothetical protein